MAASAAITGWWADHGVGKRRIISYGVRVLCVACLVYLTLEQCGSISHTDLFTCYPRRRNCQSRTDA